MTISIMRSGNLPLKGVVYYCFGNYAVRHIQPLKEVAFYEPFRKRFAKSDVLPKVVLYDGFSKTALLKLAKVQLNSWTCLIAIQVNKYYRATAKVISYEPFRKRFAKSGVLPKVVLYDGFSKTVEKVT